MKKLILGLVTALALVGIAVYFASGVAFEMLSLSTQYAHAVTEVQKSIFLSAGQTLLATYQGTAFNVSYVLVAAAFLIISIVMLKSTVFSKKTAYVGIVMAILMMLPPTAGTIGLVFSFASLMPMTIWFIQVSQTLFRLSLPHN